MQTAQEMLEAVLAECAGADALVMAAAVADFRREATGQEKLKKQDGIPKLELEVTPDILARWQAWVAKRPAGGGGLCRREPDLLENASHKLKAKKLDVIAANDISATDAGFGVDTNRITLLYPDGSQETLPLMGKDEAAESSSTGWQPCWRCHDRILSFLTSTQTWNALEAVLVDAGTVDETWCLGDIVGYGPEPNECITCVKDCPN